MNKNYIGVVVKDTNGNLSFKREQISRDYEMLKLNLINMYNNPNRTLLDMQSEFSRVFNTWQFFGVCLPYTYSSSYVGGIGTPQTITYDEYQAKLEEQRKILEAKFIDLRKKYDWNGDKEDYINKGIEEYKKELKRPYCNDCTRFIDAYNFDKTVKMIKSHTDTVMFSTEDIGWTSYEYKVNDDVLIKVHTNFGYGCASYFFLNMTYKGIDILPYSAYIYYYNADIVEIMRCTRQYSTRDRESWNTSLDFVVQTANLAKEKPEEFINEFILNEIKEMYAGLVNYMNNPDTELEKFINRGHELKNGLWNMTSRRLTLSVDAAEYKLYKNEMSTVFKAEKITGALSFLEKLKTLTPHFPQIQNYIDGINNLNNQLRPEIEGMMEKIQSDIDRITREIESEEKYLIELNDKIKPYAENLDEILKGKNTEEIKELTQSFKDENPDFAELDEEKDKQERKISTLKSDKQGRTKLFNRLEDCVGRIESHFAA